MERVTRRALRSNFVTRASTFSPASEPLRTLVGAVAGELVALDEGGQVGVDDLHLETAVLHLEDLAGDDLALLDLAGIREGIARELLDAERDALLLDVHVENLGAHHVALLELVDDLLARTVPVEIRQVDHAVDVVLEADEQTELGLVLDLALDGRADRVLLGEGLPRVLKRLLQAERDAALHLIDLEDHDLDLLGGGDDLARVDVLLRPGHLGDVDQALDARLQLHERAVIGDVRDAALELRADRIAGGDALPRIGEELLDAERDAVRLVVDLDDLHLHRLADVHDLGRVVHAPPRHVGDVQEAVDAAEIDERAVFGDVLDHAVDDLALLEVRHELGALLGAALLEHGAARHDDVAAAAVHLEDLERLRHAHERADVAHRTDVDLAARQERHGAVEIDRVAALDLVEDDAVDALAGLEGLLELHPRFLAARLVAGDDGLAQRILDALDIDLDLVADLDASGRGRGRRIP